MATALHSAKRTQGIPDYEEQLSLRHSLFRDGFQNIIRTLPIPERGRVLDIGCGDGYFLPYFNHAAPNATVIGLDVSAAYLNLVERTGARTGNCSLLQGYAERLPLRPDVFDLVWSAHSMQSYTDAERVIAEAGQVLKPGGTIAILENDRLHARVLPLSPELEIVLLDAAIAKSGNKAPAKVFQARCCEHVLHNAGFCEIRRATFVLERQTPWDAVAQRFYELLLRSMFENARQKVNGSLLRLAKATLDPRAPSYLGAQDFRYFSEFHTLFLAKKPGGDAGEKYAVA